MLRTALEAAGFIRVRRCDLNQSDDESLRNLENPKRLPDGFLQLETMSLEAMKPFKEEADEGLFHRYASDIKWN